jgi:hypothetical protein
LSHWFFRTQRIKGSIQIASILLMMCGFSFLPVFRLNDEVSILLHHITRLERIIVGLNGDNYHPDNSVGRINLNKFRCT